MAIITKTKRTAQAAPKARLTQTQKNGQRTRKAVKNWSELLECTAGFAPIRNKSVRNNTAMLLENQMRWLNENSPAMTTAMFGPQNGLHGGDLGNSDFYAPGDMRNPTTILPMVRRIYPALMSNETVGVQPMPGPVALAFAIRYRYLKGANALGDSSTEHVHGRYEDAPRTNRDSHGYPMNEDGEYTASGIRGVETKAILDETTLKLTTVVGNGFPKSFEAVVADPYNTGKFIVHPLLKQLVGAIDDASVTAISKAGLEAGIDGVADATTKTKAAAKAALDRLIAMENFDDGLMLAEKDLEMRGAGDFLGTRQKGVTCSPYFKLPSNAKVLMRAKEMSKDKRYDHLTAMMKELFEADYSEFENQLKSVTLNS